ncbi:MAG: ATP-binding protein [Kangiellaceae bacterium]|jgi:PAS domain S-box-containing protein|nr:ATP-binding protein [Kangiellaceae bacterium]
MTFTPARKDNSNVHIDGSTKAFYDFVIDMAADEVALIDSNGLMVYVNKSCVERLGYSEEELIGMHVLDIDTVYDKANWPYYFRNLLNNKHLTFDTKHIAKNGEVFPVQVETYLYRANNQDYMLAYSTDMSKQKQLELELEHQKEIQHLKERYELIFRDIDKALVIYEPCDNGEDYIFKDINPMVSKIEKIDKELVVGQKLTVAFPNIKGTDLIDVFKRVWQSGEPEKIIFEYFDGNQIRYRENHVNRLSNGELVVIYDDITDRLELEKQIKQKHKMEAIGFMASGIAHNFNNDLAIILGNLQLANIKFNDQQDIQQYLDRAETAVLRSKDLINNIITYSRIGEHKSEPVQLSSVVNETLDLLSASLPSTVAINKTFMVSGSQSLIHAASSQLHEIIVNLCNNAIHAMDEKGKLDISLSLARLKYYDIPLEYECQPGEYVCLSVQDNGAGIAPEILDNIFDPFYTTKSESEGTGMGLATVQGIVVRHGGMITVTSKVAEGTTFRIYFPLIEEQEVTAHSSKNKQSVVDGVGRILLVDDEELLVDLNREFLTRSGYDVDCYTVSTEAFSAFKANPNDYDLILTDQTMPTMTGRELTIEARKIRADIPVVLCTGYSNKINKQEAEKLNINALVNKPYNYNDLVLTIQGILNS